MYEAEGQSPKRRRAERLLGTTTVSGGEGPDYSIGFEALTDEVTVQALKLAVVGDLTVTFETTTKRGGEERLIVEARECFIECLPGRMK